MSLSDFLSVLQWWALLFVIGLVFISFTSRFFSHFADKGYAFSKMLGISIISYTIFVIGILHIAPFTQLEAWLIVFLWLVINHVRLKFNPWRLIINTSVIKLLKQNKRIFVFEEILLFLGLFFWSYVRSFAPDIHGLEKYMDFGFVNSILRSSYFPPRDIWFTPFSINYYYFGHLMTAVLTKLSGIPSFITFNLMIATLFALSFTAVFSLGFNLISLLNGQQKFIGTIRAIIGGLLSAFLVTLAGNLHILYAFFKPYPNDSPVPLWQLVFNPSGFPNSYWYPNATRFIYHTIHEFPIYSWVVSDLHGHVLDIPFVLTIIALLLSVITRSISNIQFPISNKKSKNKNTNSLLFKSWNFIKNLKFEIGNLQKADLLLISFLLAVMYMTNAWDGGIYMLLTGFVVIYLQFQKGLRFKLVSFLISIFTTLIMVVFLFIIFSLPFSIFFSPGSIAHGIGVLCAPNFLIKIGKIGPFLFEPNTCQKSPWWQLLTLYGFFAFFAVSFMVLMQRMKKVHPVDWFIFLLIILSAILIIIPEFIYVKDIYPTYYRANTMFKLVFQAFILLGIVSGYTLMRLAGIFREKLREKQTFSTLGLTAWLFVAVWLCGLVALYPYLATMSYYGNLQVYHGLDGTKYLQPLYPTDYAAINWINQNIQGQPVILEAQGDSYTDYARISSNTGLPTVLGWTVHEWLWRGSYDVPAPRIAEVQTMYTSTDLIQTKQLLQKYNVQYVFIGDLERQKYPALDVAKFDQLGKVIYKNGKTRIYKLNNL
ncbi:MAG TPA: DUF2298 domain-containing protein [Patescibacteria group bacterium]|nr:DUF2298 domain-containing protein [Patescibacteria group bacterium]